MFPEIACSSSSALNAPASLAFILFPSLPSLTMFAFCTAASWESSVPPQKKRKHNMQCMKYEMHNAIALKLPDRLSYTCCTLSQHLWQIKTWGKENLNTRSKGTQCLQATWHGEPLERFSLPRLHMNHLQFFVCREFLLEMFLKIGILQIFRIIAHIRKMFLRFIRVFQVAVVDFRMSWLCRSCWNTELLGDTQSTKCKCSWTPGFVGFFWTNSLFLRITLHINSSEKSHVKARGESWSSLISRSRQKPERRKLWLYLKITHISYIISLSNLFLSPPIFDGVYLALAATYRHCLD